MSMIKPLFVASIASLTLMMTSVRSTIDLLQKMGILPTVGRCSNCSMTTGTYKSEGLYNYFRCSNCKKKQSLLQNTVLSNSNTTLHDFVLLMYQFCNSHHCSKGNFPASRGIQGDSPVKEHYQQVVLLFPTALHEGPEEGFEQDWRRRRYS